MGKDCTVLWERAMPATGQAVACQSLSDVCEAFGRPHGGLLPMFAIHLVARMAASYIIWLRIRVSGNVQ